MVNLTARQQEIVDCDSKYCLVAASAGSGKTLVLTKRIERLLEGLRRGKKVLALTFTNKAARELRERLLEVYSKEELSEKVFVGTIHSFCAEFVARRGSTIGLPSDLHVFESVEDRLAIFADAVAAVPQLQAKVTDDKALRQLFEDVGRAKRSQEYRGQFFADSGNRMVFDEYRSRMLLQHAVDFDDILSYTTQILTEQPALAMLYQNIYRYICIDEAQDLNDAQYQVVRSLAGNACGIMMVGDTRQAIYGFNGSSATIMTKRFPEDYEVDEYVLDENFRSSEAVMRYAQAIEHTSQMVQKLAIRGEAECYEFADEVAEAHWIVNKILDLTTHGSKDAGIEDVSLDTIAVLARNRYVFEELRKALGDSGVAFNERVASGGAASSESDLFKYFHAGLRLMVNPNDQLHLQKLNIEFAPDKPYESFEDICSANSTYDGLTVEASDALRGSWSLLAKDRVPRFDLALEALNGLCETSSAFSGDDDRLLAMQDCAQWTKWWERYCLSTSPSSRSLSGFLRALSLGEVLDGQNGEGVTLSTIHLAKGLEFDVVFVIGLNSGTFPDYRSHTPTQLDEERHSMFVAITRSKRLCYITRPKLRAMPWGGLRSQIPSPFFVELQKVDAR